MTKTLYLFILAALISCAAEKPQAAAAKNNNEPAATTQTTASTQAEQKVTVHPEHSDQPRDKVSIRNEQAIKESLKITLINKETGELRLARPDEIDLEIKEGERFNLVPEDPNKQVHIQELNLRDANGKKVKINLDRVTLIEYWNEDAMGTNQFWGKMREFEKKYADSDEIQILSIYHNPVYSGRETVAFGNQVVKRFEQPKNLYFDTLAVLPDQMYVPGGVSYLLIDHRRQMTHAGRGGFPACEQVFEAVDNALKFQRAVNPVETVTVNGVPNQ
ncbi:hypothetical protein [Acanthopleuribacter pedis]|uniref:Lipoprotein n=1 Tax=Acanthopleuribacter pedis TaxID=442870 RepID=A0A8J7Q3V5_9BACT|nr:hypothetical protein [Acanthopleuribacter pedis]MBO1317176.1 hypothetical protein [Acanthopleuribacter pedis]